MRCEKSSGGWAAVRAFANSGQVDAQVTLNKPNKWDCQDYRCSGVTPQVRLVRCVTPDGLVRVMATNTPISQFPTVVFSELYHERWRIEEAFKRLKHQVKLESVSVRDNRLPRHASTLLIWAQWMLQWQTGQAWRPVSATSHRAKPPAFTGSIRALATRWPGNCRARR